MKKTFIRFLQALQGLRPGRKKRGLVSLVLAAALTAGAVGISTGRALAAEADSGSEILYEEDFSSYTEPVSLENGINYDSGWIYSKNSANGSVLIKDGAMYITGGSYDVLYLDGGSTWGNYTVEADITYLSDTADNSWLGLAYNVQAADTLQKGTLNVNTGVFLNGRRDGKWYNDVVNVNTFRTQPSGISKNQTFRLKIEVYDKTAAMYRAYYEDNGLLGSYEKILAISNIPADCMTGSIGFMTSLQSLSAKVDNIKVTAATKEIYHESFDYADTTLVSGSNEAVGLYFQQNKSSTVAEIKSGRLYLTGSGSNYDQVHFETGMHWTNYTVEADMCYENSNGWAGLLVRTASGTSSQKGGLMVDLPNATEWATLNGYTSTGGWYQDKVGVTKIQYNSGIAAGQVFRLKIMVHENSAELWYASYDENGVLSDYTKVMSVEDNYPEEHMTGSIGLMISKGHSCKVWIDNVVVSRGEDRKEQAPEPANVADVYVPETGLVNPPTVIQQVTTALPKTKAGPAVALMEIDAELNILGSSGQVIATAAEFDQSCSGTVIPAYVIDSEAEAQALSSFFQENDIIDAFVVADSGNAELVYAVRQACPKVRGVLRYASLETAAEQKAAYLLANDSLANVIISEQPLSQEAVSYFHIHYIATWSCSTDTAGIYTAIACGYSGLITEVPAEAYAVYSSITAATVSGEPLPIAHRGYHDAYPENTLSAFQAAIDTGCLAVETDLRLSKDGEIVLMHDSTIDRTTNGAGSVSSYTLAQLKEFRVDYIGDGTETIPTFQEALEAFADTGLVFYCHINTTDDKTISRFNQIVEEGGYEENVVVFIDSAMLQKYNYTTMTDGIPFAAAHNSLVDNALAPTDDLEAIERFLDLMTPYNAQPLFYTYNGHMTEEFYYRVAARGYLSTHSITNGQTSLNERLLTVQGAVGVLTDDPELTTNYAYYVDAQDAELNIGQAIDQEQTVRKILAEKNETLTCGFTQLSGPTLTYSAEAGGYTLEAAGTVTLVYYADVTVTGAAYRVYSEPVTITFTDPTHRHDWANDWEQDDEYHWQICSDSACEVVNGYEAHVYTNDSDVDCNICGYVRTVSSGSSAGLVVKPDASQSESKNEIVFSFADVTKRHWAYEDIQWAYSEGLMNGVSSSTFVPEATLTRAMVVTILYRMEGEPAAPNSSEFSDVAAGQWYTRAVSWASEQGIVTGYENGSFGPMDPITREQFAAILYRYAQFKGCDVSTGADANLLSYLDAKDVSAYAVPAMQWACGTGLIQGANGYLMPKATATRAQAAAILHRFCEE